MFGISRDTIEALRKQYPEGCRVELVSMNDPYNALLLPGCKGTVTGVDDIGTIHVNWDCGSSLGVCYGEDSCRRCD
ncbi:MAG: DUF4314 domain-containing protein [Oscillospiraceae bacterium]|nr:DUF4314 domain-containing protein [Oscillospiraceae bacterium]